MSPTRHDLQTVRARTSSEEWERRQAVASEQAEVAERIEGRKAAGESERAAIRAEAPDDAETTWVARLRRYRAEGRDGLVPRQLPPLASPKMTPEARGVLRGILSVDPSLRSEEVRSRLLGMGIDVSASLVRRVMKAEGLSHPRGAAGHRGQLKREPLRLAGSELLKALDEEVGATAQLTRDLLASLESLEPPRHGALPDPGARDDKGRFLPAYNEAKPRTEPELGEKSDSVELKRAFKDLPAMRTAKSSEQSLLRKVRALVLLPCVTDSPRWSALRHWQGDALGELVGHAYQPSTLDKFLRELKYGAMGGVAGESVASFWLGQDELLDGPLEGIAALYIDTSTKPVHTHHFSRCTKISKLGGRIMPGTSTVFLHAGMGTPVLFESWSGHVSMPQRVGALLDRYEALAGEQTARRLVIMDREAHAAWLFKELASRDCDFIVPLRSNVVGPGADFRELTEWTAYAETGDELCGGLLRLRDSQVPDELIDVRVVGRRRRRTGKVAWFATRVSREEFSDTVILDAYFARWPLQEHAFRDANGRVHLGAHYGYGKHKVDNVAVLDKLDKLDGKLRKLDAGLERDRAASLELSTELTRHAVDTQQATARLTELQGELDEAVTEGRSGTDRFRADYLEAKELEAQIGRARALERRADALVEGLDSDQAARDKVAQTRQRLLGQRRVFTMDTELDQVMTAFKICFINLCGLFLQRYLGGHRMQLDTLIRGILTLPGERVTTRTTETIRIWRHSRDRQLMPLIETACVQLTAKKLRRGKRVLRFELVDRPDP